jgi:hypothetical protein
MVALGKRTAHPGSSDESDGDDNPAKRRATGSRTTDSDIASSSSTDASTEETSDESSDRSTDDASEGAIDERLMFDPDTELAVYGDFEAADRGRSVQVSQLASRYSAPPELVQRMDVQPLRRQMIALKNQGRLAEAMQDDPPQFIDVTDAPGAAGTVGVGPCLVVMMKATTPPGPDQRTYLGATHFSTHDRLDAAMDPRKAYDCAFGPMDEALAALNTQATQKEYYLIGGNPADTLESSVALAHAAELLNLNVKACLLPSHKSGEVTDAMLTTDGLRYSTMSMHASDRAPAEFHWLQAAQSGVTR